MRTEYTIKSNETSEYQLIPTYQPNKDGWVCYLFGTTDKMGMVYYPKEGHIPNLFVRWKKNICLGYTWDKKTKNED